MNVHARLERAARAASCPPAALSAGTTAATCPTSTPRYSNTPAKHSCLSSTESRLRDRRRSIAFKAQREFWRSRENGILLSPQSGEDNYPSYYTYSYPHALLEAYLKQWHAEHDPVPGKEPTSESFSYHGASWDELKPHLWTFFRAVKSRKPVTEDAVFGHNAALACHMANESYFRRAPVTWDATTNQIKS